MLSFDRIDQHVVNISQQNNINIIKGYGKRVVSPKMLVSIKNNRLGGNHENSYHITYEIFRYYGKIYL